MYKASLEDCLLVSCLQPEHVSEEVQEAATAAGWKDIMYTFCYVHERIDTFHHVLLKQRDILERG